jgi:hypothetical protein
MNIQEIVKLASKFELLAIAEKEELPENSANLNVVLNNIENLITYKARKKYAENNLKHLSSGSSRIVYLTKNKTVIKLAKNDRGIAQNKAESNPKFKSKYINKILSKAENYSWIQVPFNKKITEKQFEKMTGFDFDDFGDAIRYALKTITSKSIDKPDNFDDFNKSSFFKEIVQIGKKNKLMPGDLARISSWLTNGKYPILGDSGLTRKIFEEFYDSN